MKKSTWVIIGIMVIGMGWLTLTGRIDLGWLWALGLGGGYAASKIVTDRTLDETKETIKNGRDLHEKHKEEVERIEEADFTAGMSDADLIASANERERERTRTTVR